MGAIGEVIQYLRSCYEADNREASIFNLRAERVQHLEFLSKGGDFVRGLLDVVPIERTKALEAQKAAAEREWRDDSIACRQAVTRLLA